jgi:uncharacterized protein YprB with RNaseH-like and TPR domain
MSLRDRLTRLTGETAKPVSDPRQERIADLRRKLDRAMNRPAHNRDSITFRPGRPVTPLEKVVTGEEVRTPHGSFFVSENITTPDDLHGRMRIGEAASASIGAAAFLAGSPLTRDASISDALFLDTETTGLMGGTGTFPFLIGLGWFKDGSFVTCQLFARDFSEEGAMLRHLSEIASGKQFLVTFNGKAYDMNLLSTRFVLNRCTDTLSTLLHIDLLHPSRRMLGHRLENARLSTIETGILGVERNGDVPGSEIPQRYFNWLRRRDGNLVEDIFVHNRLDIVSLASLLKYLTDLMEPGCSGRHPHHGDLLRLAGLIQDRGDIAKAGRMLEQLMSSHRSDVARSARISLSLIYKRAHRWEEAVGLWQDLVESDPCDVFAVEELAKFYEHRTRDHEKALQLINGLLNGKVCLDDTVRASIERRYRRLLDKTCSE